MGRRERWQAAQDVGLAAVVAGLGLAEVWVPFNSVAGAGSPVVTTCGILAEAALLTQRRRHPVLLAGIPVIWVVAALISGGALQVVFFGQLVPLCVALYSVARHGSRRDIAVVGGAAVIMLLLGDLSLPALQQASEILFHWGVTSVVFCIGLGMRASEHRAVAAAVRATEAEAAAREAAARAVSEERARIARELHDILGHSVSVMVVQAGAAAQAVDDDPAFVRKALEAIRATGTQSLDEVRRVVALLRTDEDTAWSPQPGLAQLPELVDQARADGLCVELVETGDGGPLWAGLELAAYRIVQESLTNIRKHANARQVLVEVTHSAEAVAVSVTDDGAPPAAAGPATSGPAASGPAAFGGGPAASAVPGPGRNGMRPGAGNGLVGMRERAALYGGTLVAGPLESGGWQVRAVLPALSSR